MKNMLLSAAGFVLLGLGAVGLALPVWPTTPFVLAAAACFAGSPRMRERLVRMPFFGEHIRNYREGAGLSRRTLITSLIFLWGMLALSGLLAQKLWLIVLLLAVGAAVTFHLVKIAKPREQTAREGEDA